MQICSSCKFWQPPYGEPRDEASWGECRRSEPKRKPKGMRVPKLVSREWATTLHDDWCGKWSVYSLEWLAKNVK